MYRWRGYWPLLMAPVVAFGFRGFHYPANSHLFDLAWEFFCLFVSLSGVAIRVLVMGYSPPGTSYVGPNTRNLKMGKLKTTGMYSICRNPLYLGNFFMALGVFLFTRSFVVTLIYVLVFMLYYERLIMGEEGFLSREFGAAYRDWADRTPVFIPKFSLWIHPDFPFSWRIALRREYKRLFAVLCLMTVFEVVGDFLVEGRLEADPVWTGLFLAGLLFYLGVLFLKRKTRWLDVKR